MNFDICAMFFAKLAYLFFQFLLVITDEIDVCMPLPDCAADYLQKRAAASQFLVLDFISQIKARLHIAAVTYAKKAKFDAELKSLIIDVALAA